MYFSAKRNQFFPDEYQAIYESKLTWPSDAVAISEGEWKTYGEGKAPLGMQRGADADGHPIWVEIPPLPIDVLAVRKREAMDMARDAAFSAGLPYDIAGAPDVVQTRPQDQINLLGLAAKAQRLLAAGDTTTQIPFRGLSNETYHLIAEQMDALALAALAHIEGIYQHSWDCKDSITAALEAGDRAAIEAVEW